MLSELSYNTRQKVRTLGTLMKGNGVFSSIEQRENHINMLKDAIADIVISKLLLEDKNNIGYFLTSK